MKTAAEWARVAIEGCFLTSDKQRSLKDMEALIMVIQGDAMRNAQEQFQGSQMILWLAVRKMGGEFVFNPCSIPSNWQLNSFVEAHGPLNTKIGAGFTQPNGELTIP